jgi:hypothetical protein
MFRRATRHRILNGARPADLPGAPDQVQLVINLKAARQLASPPPSLLSRATTIR